MKDHLRDHVRHKLAAATDVGVVTVRENSEGARYRITLDITIDADALAVLSAVAGKKNRTKGAVIRRYARYALETLRTADDQKAPDNAAAVRC